MQNDENFEMYWHWIGKMYNKVGGDIMEIIIDTIQIENVDDNCSPASDMQY